MNNVTQFPQPPKKATEEDELFICLFALTRELVGSHALQPLRLIEQIEFLKERLVKFGWIDSDNPVAPMQRYRLALLEMQAELMTEQHAQESLPRHEEGHHETKPATALPKDHS